MNKSQHDTIVAALERTLGQDFKKLSKNMDDVVYENQHIRITANYFTSGNDKSMLLGIKKIRENKSYFFGEYLHHVGKEDIKPNDGEDDSHFINRYLDVFRMHYEGSLKEVISGKKWIDVPRDFGTYR
jgi:hypothetical protein